MPSEQLLIRRRGGGGSREAAHRPGATRRRAHARVRLLHRPRAADGLPDAAALVLHFGRGLPLWEGIGFFTPRNYRFYPQKSGFAHVMTCYDMLCTRYDML